jgi:hypothetical protein
LGYVSDAWCRRGGNNGLSIPYIIGARTVVDKNFKIPKEDIESFISELVNSEFEGFEVYLFYCRNIETFVIGTKDHPHSMYRPTIGF